MKYADMHCDTVSMIQYKRNRGEHTVLRKNDMRIDLEKLRQGGYMLQTFAIFTDLEEKDPLETALEQSGLFYQEMEENRVLIAPVTTMAQVDRNMADGKLSALLSLEGGDACRGNLSVLRDFYRLGVRMMTLTWNFPNELGWPNTQAFCDGYGEIIDAVRERQPEATVYIQSILPVSAEVSAQNIDNTNNQQILKFNEMLKDIAKDKNAVYLDVASVMTDSDGNLPNEAATDGIHPGSKYYQKWADYLKENTVPSNGE